jgi:hypothetical protein
LFAASVTELFQHRVSLFQFPGEMRWLLPEVSFCPCASACGSPDAVNPLTPEEMKALGIEGDTPRDTVATLVGQVKQLRAELRNTLEGNTAQKAENERLRAREGTIDQRIRNALEGERKRLQEEREQLARERREPAAASIIIVSCPPT